jgi:hypothetical protein
VLTDPRRVHEAIEIAERRAKGSLERPDTPSRPLL